MFKWLKKFFGKKKTKEIPRNPRIILREIIHLNAEGKPEPKAGDARRITLPNGLILTSSWYKALPKLRKHKLPFLMWKEYDEKMRGFARFARIEPASSELSAKKRWSMEFKIRKQEGEKIQEAA